MNNGTGRERPTLGVRLLHTLLKEPDWSTLTIEDIVAFGEAATRKAASPLARVVTGLPDHDATVRWQTLILPDRTLRVRVYRPSRTGDAGANLPLVLHVHLWARRCKATG